MSTRRKPNSGDPRKRREIRLERSPRPLDEAERARVTELLAKYGKGRNMRGKDLLAEMPDGPDKRELLALLARVPEETLRTGKPV